MLEYKINDAQVLITGFSDKPITHIDIPEFIDGHPVTGIQLVLFPHIIAINIPKSVKYIYESCFIYAHQLTYINNIKLNTGVNLINDNFIYFISSSHTIIYKVKFNIIDDKVLSVYEKDRYIICGRLRNKNFN